MSHATGLFESPTKDLIFLENGSQICGAQVCASFGCWVSGDVAVKGGITAVLKTATPGGSVSYEL